MTIADWLIESMVRLRDTGVDSPRRDTLVLLEDTLKKDRAWVVAHPEQELSEERLETLGKLIDRRLKREPLAYIRGKSWFYGRFFEVNPSVMIPRPESEAFITLLKDLQATEVIDIGTGSGCLAITAKLEIPNAKVTAVDVSPEALDVAKKNAESHNVDVEFLESDLLSSLISSIESQTTIIANLPYVPDGMITSPEIATEPALALFSGNDGLNHYRKFWNQIHTLHKKPKNILNESLESQHSTISDMAKKSGYKLQKTEQLTQFFVLQNSTLDTSTQ